MKKNQMEFEDFDLIVYCDVVRYDSVCTKRDKTKR